MPCTQSRFKAEIRAYIQGDSLFMNIESIPWQLMADFLIIILCAAPLLATAGLPVMSVAGQVLSQTRQRTSYKKCAKQLTQLALIFGWLLTIGGAGILWTRVAPTLMAAMPADGQPLDYFSFIINSVPLQADILIWLTLLGATLALTLYYSLWNTLREQEALHQCLGILAAFWYCMVIYGSTCIISVDTAYALGITRPGSLTRIFSPDFTTSFWNTAPYLPMLIFSMAAGSGGVWLVIRRYHDDYGRDYYAQMMPWCAVWARNAWFVLWIILVAVTAMQWLPLLQSEDYLTAPEFISNAVFLVLWIIPGLLWTLAVRSASPLRHKITLVLAFLLSTGILVPMYLGLISEVAF